VSSQVLEEKVRETVVSKAVFTPEFLNRFDKVLVFNPLNLEVAKVIANAVVKNVVREYEVQKKIVLNVDSQKIFDMVEGSFSPSNGAREIERVVREYVSDLAAKEVLTQV
jgi:ATP-dependent Clp protease ATP-binding subunit ClpA